MAMQVGELGFIAGIAVVGVLRTRRSVLGEHKSFPFNINSPRERRSILYFV
jgi:hypothetical protein